MTEQASQTTAQPANQPASQPANASLKLATGLWRKTRRLFILIVGLTVMLIGVVLLVTPGPAMLVIPLGLAILATEFVWAKRLLQRIKASATSAASAVAGKADTKNQQPGQYLPKPAMLTRLRNACLALIAPFRAGYVDPDATPSTRQLEAFPSSSNATQATPPAASPATSDPNPDARTHSN